MILLLLSIKLFLYIFLLKNILSIFFITDGSNYNFTYREMKVNK